MSELIPVAKTNEIPEGKSKVVTVNGKTIAIFHHDGKFYALDHTCAHRGGPLGDGFLEGNTVVCPWHGWEFDLETGQCMNMPGAFVAVYSVVVEGEEIKIQL